ncbi:hypothetical protein FHX49_002523 [Microbacterium endophyticum]|uniref:Uncharacterized protein n=1 Tax=Microbacterium endophyticum TaxID=1526412 RepID=A0A7W4V503_9MICO|nr:hypothetical protein [Microbacterium endophyticum]MBB2976935.1 hypothetical protein [Microbacterium endophyticum]NIK35747.1 hypothetical protein [Microbacterium endophyticum]
MESAEEELEQIQVVRTLWPGDEGSLGESGLAGEKLHVVIERAVDLIDSTITNIAAPSIAADLGAGDSMIK